MAPTFGFHRNRRGVLRLHLGADERQVLQHVVTEMVQLLTPDDSTEAVDDDPLARALGIGTATEVPEDPALARLFPSAYPEDVEAAGDFRRYTEPGLRDRKLADLRIALGALGDPDPATNAALVLLVDDDQATAWLGALNDTRLVLGARLGVSEDLEELLVSLPDDDPRLGLYWVYDRLTWLQETLVRALAAGL